MAATGSGYIDLAALDGIHRSKIYANNMENATAIMRQYGVVAYTPVNGSEQELYNQTLDRMAILLRRLVMEQPHANRGLRRYCLNDFNKSLFLQESYDVLNQILQPGRFTLHLLQDEFEETEYDTGLGDYVCAGAEGGVPATQWHQDWDLPGHMICVSVFSADITDDDAPMLLALGDEIIKRTGAKGTIVMRDVAVWHKGTAHLGNADRIMPSYRFSTLHAQRLGYGLQKMLNARTAAKFPPCIRKFLRKRVREPALSTIWQPSKSMSDDHNVEEYAVAPVLEGTVASIGKRIWSALLNSFSCLGTSEKKPADDKPKEKQLQESRPSSMYSIQ